MTLLFLDRDIDSRDSSLARSEARQDGYLAIHSVVCSLKSCFSAQTLTWTIIVGRMSWSILALATFPNSLSELISSLLIVGVATFPTHCRSCSFLNSLSELQLSQLVATFHTHWRSCNFPNSLPEMQFSQLIAGDATFSTHCWRCNFLNSLSDLPGSLEAEEDMRR